ncbi:hypothetical protein BDV96DRAFT_269333 [Lophiotrema nucula]|uniref:DUF4139 domain-containing protein n=1 Tax=Lophiotrema nucula TaxID=690887 RepID=A0A6A5ZLS9_9PLEO|nr:hypothetical protein BDV96DRAFT_269333 [Lophiotrema nucula]
MVFGNSVNAPEPEGGMPTDASKQTYNIKDLSTKSVILYPTRAHIIRQIENVLLKPGANEVEIYGLSPTVDEHSIQIEGQGAASIVDLTVQLVPNRDIFEELFPEESESSDDDSDEDFRDSDDEDEPVVKIARELKDLRLEVTKATETQNSAAEQLTALDRYPKTVKAENNSPDDVSKMLSKYSEDRQAIFEVHNAASQKLIGLQKQIKRKEHEKEKASKEGKKQREKLAKQKAKDRRSKELRKEEKRKEARHTKQERMRYWPKKAYKVTLLLEGSIDTPGSSRRNSIDSVTIASVKDAKPNEDDKSVPGTPVSLLLSYVTKEAGWSPRYDLRISSLQKTATIVYRTEFLNRTSETWKDAKLSFSTSQTSYQGLDDVVPFMHSWHVRLSRYDNGDGGLLSTTEKGQNRYGKPVEDSFNRTEVFGLDDNFIPAYQSKRPLAVQQSNNAGGLFGSSRAPQASASFGGNTSSSFGASSQAQASAFGSSHALVERIQERGERLDTGIQSARAAPRMASAIFRKSRGTQEPVHEEVSEQRTVAAYDPTIEDSAGISGGPEAIEFEESSWEDNGLTATYDVPGVRTLTPSSTTRRHKIASLNASNIHLSHICVPKLRSAAFLRAKIRNPSSTVTLLKGSAGVTLDGSFLGNMNLPRVSPGQIFDLPLGVDPAIHINYPKPNVHRSTQGIIFNKESAQVFTRSIWLNNTKPMPIDLLVLDQVPVSEDERLRIVVSTPRGLAKEGDSVKAGVSAKEGSSGAVSTNDKGAAWGSAVAKMKKNGEINWTVKLEKGQGCLLKLEYEARLPPSEKIVPA